MATLGEPFGSETLQKLYKKRQLWNPRNYARLRPIFAERFRQAHQEQISKSLSPAVQSWLEKHEEFTEEFFTAIDPQHDNIDNVLHLLDKLCTQFPDKVATNPNLAIAVAVTWDNPQRGVYHYEHHQRRAKAAMPDAQVGAIGNFRHLAGSNSGQYLPWEFLLYAVNHTTPLDERDWAIANYAQRTANFGKCYHDVPYDNLMLKSQSQIANLNGHAYTLPSLRQYGGVCAHQADFASRVGKSLGIPANYVRGENVYNDWHAWVCWVELTAPPTAKQIQFQLKSHGRYRGDKYYVGELRHPQTGKKITDRQMELDLHTVGLDYRAKRQAALVMAAFPELCKSEQLSVREQLHYLSRVTKLCPGNTHVWQAMAKLCRDGNVERADAKVMRRALDQLFDTFRNVPDFTWTVFDDLVQYETEAKRRLALYEQLIGLYVEADRPDLASLARLRQTELFLELDRPIDAAKALGRTIMAFAADGRYAPKMLKRMVAICVPLEGGSQFLDGFWPGYLSAIPERRNSTLSKYFVRMHKQAIDWYQRRNHPDAVRQIELRLDQVVQSSGPPIGATPR